MENVILFVEDVQETVLSLPLYNKEEVIENIKCVVALCREKNVEVAYIRHNDDGGCKPGTDGWKIYDPVAPAGDEKIIDKTFNSAFLKTDLDDYLKSKGYKNLIIMGMLTDYCVDATIKSAFERGYNVFVPENTVTNFGNEYINAQGVYEYYTKCIWDNRFAKMISIEDLGKLL